VNLTFIPVSAYSGQANVNIISVHAAFAVLSSCIIKLIAINSNKSLSKPIRTLSFRQTSLQRSF